MIPKSHVITYLAGRLIFPALVVTLIGGGMQKLAQFVGQPPIGGTFAYTDFASLDDLELVGNARVNNKLLELTPLDIYQVGAVWYRRKVNVASGFQTAFVFGVRRNEGMLGSDGLAFVIQADRPDAIGGWGGNLGYNGIRKSVAIELDMIKNLDMHDPNANDFLALSAEIIKKQLGQLSVTDER